MNCERSVGENGELLSVERKNADISQEAINPGSNGLIGRPDPSGQVLPGGVHLHSLPRQIVTLTYLSERLPAPLLSEQVARSLAAETETAVVLVRLQPQRTTLATDNGALPEPFLNGEFHMPSALRKNQGGFYQLTLGVRSDPPTPAGIASMVSHLSRHFRYVLIETLADNPPAPWLFELLLHSDLAYLFLQPTSESVHQLGLITRDARLRSRNRAAHLKPIACLAEGEKTEDLDLLAQRVASPLHMFVRGCPPRSAVNNDQTQLPASFCADVRRVAREIGGRLVGLALSSGAAKGFAHVGVIQVLEENGIEVDVVAGASMGAYVGALWAHGCDGAELERLAREMEGRWAFWSLIDPVFPPRQGFLRGFGVKKRLMRTIGNSRFGDLQRPLRVVAANLATLERVVFCGGEVATAVHASSAVPGICVPIIIDGEPFVDGGIVDPLPVTVLREMGASRLIAVDVIPTPEQIRSGMEAERLLAQQNGSGSPKLFRKAPTLDRQLNYFARGNLFEILMRSVHGAQIRMAEASCKLADVVVHPDICDDRWLDCRNPGKFIALGREAAIRHLDEIKALVAKKEVTHEQELIPESVASIA